MASARNFSTYDENLGGKTIPAGSSSRQIQQERSCIEKDEQQFNEEVRNGHRRGNGEDGTQDGTLNSHKDPFVDSVRGLAAVQEALEKEVHDLREIGNDFKATESLELILKQNDKHLESKLDETKAMPESKDAKKDIHELEDSKIEHEVEGLFRRRFKADIEHQLLTTSLQTSGVLEGENKTEASRKAQTKTTGKTCQLGLCFLTLVILLVFILRFLISLVSPNSPALLPT